MSETAVQSAKPSRLGAFIVVAGIVLVLAGGLFIASRDYAAAGGSPLLTQARAIFGTLPDTMPGGKDDLPAQVELGRRLYFERGLSANRTQSCNDCHRIDGGQAGIDGLPTSLGALGESGTRNAPTVLNAGFQASQFWDGRAPDLVEQAKGPLLNPIEMAMPDAEAVEQRLAELGYANDFAAAFPQDRPAMSFHNAARALAAFERTLIARSRFDDYLAGNEQALTAAEKRGLETFIRQGCTTCHSGPLLGGVLFQKMGVFFPYDNREDLGRYTITGRDADRYVFKVPMLRNVTRTAPYFHDGRVETLDEAVRQMARLQLGHDLTEQQVDLILQFLAATESRAGADESAATDGH